MRGRITGVPLGRCSEDPPIAHGVLQHQGIADHLLPWPYTGNDFLDLVRQAVSGRDFRTPELVAAYRHVDPIAVVQMQNRCGGTAARVSSSVHGMWR